MKSYRFSSMLALVLAVAVLVCGCGGKPESRPDLTAYTAGRQLAYTFGAGPSGTVSLSPAGAQAVLATVEAQRPTYAYTELYQLEEVKSRLDFTVAVEHHARDARNGAGVLDAAHLAGLVAANNAAYMAQEPFGYKVVEQDYVEEICAFLVEVVEAMLARYPTIDRERIYCNLGHLKILYDVGSLSYAQVTHDLVLALSATNNKILTGLKGEDGFSRVMTHETMHLLQIGCPCEQIERAGRRCGICIYWEDFTLNFADWGWFFEGSAERNMCNLTGKDAITYQYKMDYLCSFTLSVLLRDGVAADTMETLCFQSDPEQLFAAFGCENEAQREELLNMMITMEVLQMQPEEFFLQYEKRYGSDPREDEEGFNQFLYGLKPAVCLSLAREFYTNLTAFLQENPLPENDLFFLLSCFEGQINQHLTYAAESKAAVNAPFLDGYRAMRDALFAELTAQDGPDVAARYAAYSLMAWEGVLNATLSALPQAKRDFLAERAEWMASLDALGVKVPA